MAKQKGHIKYVGTLGDVRHFKIKGNKGFFAGLVGGPTAEQVKTAQTIILRKNTANTIVIPRIYRSNSAISGSEKYNQYINCCFDLFLHPT